MIGVVAALPLEARCLTRARLKIGESIALDTGGWIHVSGIGRANAQRAAHSLLDAGASALLSWGVAGGLAPELTAGTLVLPQVIIAAEKNQFAVDPVWRARLHDCLAPHVVISGGAITESLSVISDPRQKQKLAQASGAAAVDMESAAIAQVAREANVPFAAIRVVVDTAAMSIPRSIIRATDETGVLHAAKFLCSLLARPADIGELMVLSRNFRAARTTLKTIVRLAGAQLAVNPNP
ncbi:MAG: hypothetical protein ACREUV_07330 [Burkholderiales bacterium]